MGAVIALNAGFPFITGTALCWLGLFGPGVLLVFGVLPFWGRVRRHPTYRRALPGLNAAAVGLVGAAVLSLFVRLVGDPGGTDAAADGDAAPDAAASAAFGQLFPRANVGIMAVAFASAEVLSAPAPLVVLLGGALGVFAWGVGMN